MGSKCDHKWIDLSVLPRLKGLGTKIDWKNSVGCRIPFECGNAAGYIEIVEVMECVCGKRYMMITIDKYAPTPVKIRTDYLQNGNINDLVYNKIVDARPDLIQYLDNPDDAYIYSYGSTKLMNMHCPICGYKKQFDAAHLSTQGFGCPICGDGVKYPNKFISALLDQLGINYVREATKKHKDLFWAEDFRYDFYVKLNNYKILIEADGGFHRYEEQKERDMRKDALAKQYGFMLIRIDCDYRNGHRFAYIKEHIIQSELNNILDLSHVNWKRCDKRALSSITHEACLLWNDGKSIQEIAQTLGVCLQTVAKYLKRGREIGLCPSYNKQESRRRIVYRSVLCWNEQHDARAFKDISELIKLSVRYFGKQFNRTGILNTCKNKQLTHHGFYIKYITKEEYEQYKMINNNEVVLKEAII